MEPQLDEKQSITSTADGAPSEQEPSLNEPEGVEKSTFDQAKADDIQDACRWRDIPRLAAFADTPGGLLTDSLRQEAWPILLGVETKLSPAGETKDLPVRDDSSDWKELPRHHDEDQVLLDVNRSFIYYPHNESQSQLSERKRELNSLICQVLRRHPYLHYFQGYHDIAQVLLLVLTPSLRVPCASRLSVLRIRDFMLPTLGPTSSQLRLLPDILAKADPKLRRHLAGVEPFYALAGTLTMYSHDIEGYGDIARLFDVFLSREPVFSIYVFAQIVINRQDELYEFDDSDMLQVVLGKVPPKMDLDKLVADSIDLFQRYPPKTLRSWRFISENSVLKTARDTEACARARLDEGEEHFAKHAKEVRWTEVQDQVKMAIWSYRKPATAVGMTVAVGVLAIYLRRNPGIMHQATALFSR